MKNDIPWLLLQKVFTQKASPEESLEAEHWIKAARENGMIYGQLKNFFDENGSLPLHFTPDVIKAYKTVAEQTGLNKHGKARILKMSTWAKVAAVLVLALIGWWIVDKQDVLRAITYATISTNDSVQTIIVLPDGSKVWLNYGSELHYSKRFKTNRELQLKGEAYFEVAHDAKHPFVVHANKASVHVLGTKFNMTAYTTSAIDNVTLIKGKVSYSSGKEKVTLLPGDKGLFSKETGALQKTINDDPNFLSWKTKTFIFNNAQLTDVFNDLSKVYRVKFKLSNPSLQSLTLSAKFSNRPVEEILRTISITLSVKIEKQSGIYIIY